MRLFCNIYNNVHVRLPFVHLQPQDFEEDVDSSSQALITKEEDKATDSDKEKDTARQESTRDDSDSSEPGLDDDSHFWDGMIPLIVYTITHTLNLCVKALSCSYTANLLFQQMIMMMAM